MANQSVARGGDNILERFINYSGSLFAKLHAVIIYNSSETEIFTAGTPGQVEVGTGAGAGTTIGATGDAAVITDTTGTLSGKLRGLVKWAFERMPASLGQTTKAGSLPVTMASDQGSLGTVDSSDIPTAVTEYNVTLTNADTEYSQALPATTRGLSFRCRSPVAVRYAWATGKVAGPTSPYQTLQADAEYYKEIIEMSSPTIYLASGTAGVVVEIEAWS